MTKRRDLALAVERLDTQERPATEALRRAEADGDADAVLTAVDALLDIAERRAALLGLDAAVRTHERGELT